MATNQLAQIRRRRAKSLRIGEVAAGEFSLGDVVLYESDGSGVRLEVRLERETVWLTQAQMAELFQRDRTVVTRHIANVFEDGELDEKSNVQKMHIASGDRPTALYSLDVVVSVGYRVKSPRGTQFRIWATRTLKEHLIRGYTLNDQRLRERGFSEIREAVALLGRTSDSREPAADLSVANARALVNHLRGVLAARGEATDLFGREREQQLSGVLAAIEQTFDGVALYRSAQARAAVGATHP